VITISALSEQSSKLRVVQSTLPVYLLMILSILPAQVSIARASCGYSSDATNDASVHLTQANMAYRMTGQTGSLCYMAPEVLPWPLVRTPTGPRSSVSVPITSSLLQCSVHPCDVCTTSASGGSVPSKQKWMSARSGTEG
jgi:hypothetical protein